MKRLLLLAVMLLAVITFVLWTLRYLWYLVFDTKVSWQLAVSLDQLANTVFNGHEDETISSRAGRHCRDSHPEDKEVWACWLCKALDKLDPNHCEKSIGV
jgi:hypothetical protein